MRARRHRLGAAPRRRRHAGDRARGAKAVVTDAAQTPIWRAIGVGVFQTLALIPGVSRSGATIYGGLLLGLDRRAAAEFSFFLAMPTMVAAFIYDFMKVKDHITPAIASPRSLLASCSRSSPRHRGEAIPRFRHHAWALGRSRGIALLQARR
jgi:hypothetical protein